MGFLGSLAAIAVLITIMVFVINKLPASIGMPIKNFFKGIFRRIKPHLSKIIVALIIIIVILWGYNAMRNYFSSNNKQFISSGEEEIKDDGALPYALTKGSVIKINDAVTRVIMNGSEENGVDTGVNLSPGQEFSVEQMFFDDYKQNRIVHNKKGDANPIWGGGYIFSSDPKAKYKIPGTGNGVLVFLRPENGQKDAIFYFKIGKTKIRGISPFKVSAKIILYYNCRIYQIDKNTGQEYNGHSQCGWDGSTTTLIIKKV